MPLRDYLRGDEVVTAFDLGWSALANGELLRRAEEEQFDVFVTTDQQLRYQQNLTTRVMAIVVLPHANWIKLRPSAAAIAAAITSARGGSYLEIDVD